METPLLRIDGLSLRFGGVDALDAVSFDVGHGEIHGLIGPNGAGKTTLFNCISRVYTPDRGHVYLRGSDLLRLPAHRIIAHGVARTFQNLEVFGSMSVTENLLVGMHVVQPVNLLAEALRLPAARRSERAALLRAEEMIEFLGLAPYAGAPASALPFGVKKRLEMGRALMSKPRLLLLDEPANGLSHAEIARIGQLVRTVRDELDVTVLLVEHHMGLVMDVCDRITVLNFGRKIAGGTPDEVQRDPAVIEAYLGEPVA